MVSQTFKSLLDLLLDYKPEDKAEAEDLKRMIVFVQEHGNNCFDRNYLPGHVTGSAWIENATGDKFLLTLHKKLGLWLQVGGHADGNTNILEVAFKEAYEESGLEHLELAKEGIFDLNIHYFSIKSQPDHWHYDIRFLLKTKQSDDAIKLSDESLDLKWFTALPPNPFPEQMRMFRKWKELSRSKHS